MTVIDALELSGGFRRRHVEGRAARVSLAVCRAALQRLEALRLRPDLVLPIRTSASADTEQLVTRSC